MAYKQKSSDFSKLFAVWTGLELFKKKTHFSGLSREPIFGGTELLIF
ncbi:MAG: hypothetical protein RIM83_01435 [Allomuricauda sp.]